MALQELQIYGLWAGKQTAKGTANTAPGRRFKQVAGRFQLPREDGSQNSSDATQFTDTEDWVNTLVGNGNPGVAATPDELAWLLWAFEGGETTSAVTISSTADTTLGSPNLTNVNPTTGWVNGMTVTGAGIPSGTTIVSGAGTATMVMSANATATAAGVTITGSQDRTRHSFSSLPGLGHWLTWISRQGSAVIDRLQFNDCQISQVEIGGSQGSKGVRITPSVISLDPGEQRSADPAQAMPATKSFLYTDGTSRFEIDGTVYRGHSEFTLVINKDLQPVYSDDVTVFDLAIGNAVVTISVTLYFDADGRAAWNKQLYGVAAPAAGAKPIKHLPALGSYKFDLRQRDTAGVVNGNKFVVSVPGVKWAVPDAPDPNPDGGVPTITLAGAMRKTAPGASPYTIDVDTDAAAFTT